MEVWGNLSVTKLFGDDHRINIPYNEFRIEIIVRKCSKDSPGESMKIFNGAKDVTDQFFTLSKTRAPLKPTGHNLLNLLAHLENCHREKK